MPILETGSGSTPENAAFRDHHAARLQLTNELNQLLRRFRSYTHEGEWIAAVNEGAARFAGESAVFAVDGRMLRLRAQSGLQCAPGLSMALSTASAFAAAVESKDPVVALRTSAEVGAALSTKNHSDRARIVPILNGSRVVAILFAAGTEAADANVNTSVDINGLELLTNIASLALERKGNDLLHTQLAPAAGTPAPVAEKKSGLPRKLAAWAHLSDEQRMSHSRAQRMARVKVAEMELSKPEACRAGRREGNFYLFLKREMDAARDSYRKQFMAAPGMVDYLHLEIVGNALGGDEQKLGADYPGQLD
jgi:hypothetical protein